MSESERFSSLLPACRRRFDAAEGRERETFLELIARLPQLDLLLGDVERAYASYMGTPMSRKHTDQAVPVRTYAECFYYLAARVVELLVIVFGPKAKRGDGGRLLGAFEVRQHLIEHPEKPDGAFEGSWEMGEPHLVRLKVHEHHGYRDQGLRANADELYRRADRLLDGSEEGKSQQ